MTPTLIQHLKYNGLTDYGDQIILGKAQKKETFTKVKLKIVSNLAKITGRRWWLHLNHTTLFHLKTKSNKNTYTSKETALISWIYT